jgi:hypothetical protein
MTLAAPAAPPVLAAPVLLDNFAEGAMRSMLPVHGYRIMLSILEQINFRAHDARRLAAQAAQPKPDG